MYSRLDDLLAFAGAGCVLAGIYLWLGLPAALILAGLGLIYTGWRIDVGSKT